ncbi:MAG TPA: class I SAM-dependent methyltransferase [Micromonosporaceae bacterium]|jgi:SAM-dependent methyltransferase|nr:class I SAM-dependent methyltransferase [Micromonosporaceae bacterium]
MLAEILARSGQTILRGLPPDGRAYWRRRFWDRDAAERHPVLAGSFIDQKAAITGYLSRYGASAERVLEFGCGTGEFTAAAASLTPAREIVAMDISSSALDIARQRVRHENLRLVQGDFWADNGVGTADLVLCVDAIHHLGDMRSVLTRLRSFVAPGGILIGNVWTADHFHEFQRMRYGPVRHATSTCAFFAAALAIRLSGGRVRARSYRTQLLPRTQVESVVRAVLGEPVSFCAQRYFMSFVCRP